MSLKVLSFLSTRKIMLLALFLFVLSTRSAYADVISNFSLTLVDRVSSVQWGNPDYPDGLEGVFIPYGTNFGSSAKIGSIKVNWQQDDGDYSQFYITDYNGASFYPTNVINDAFDGLATFYFSSTSTIDLSVNKLASISGSSVLCNPGCSASPAMGGDSSVSVYSGERIIYTIYDETGEDTITSNIEFSTNHLTSTTTPDFKNWALEISASNSIYKLAWGVNYKQASSSSWQYNDFYYNEATTTQSYYQQLEYLEKTNHLFAGDYVAVAYLAYVSATSEVYSLLASSSPLSFTIEDGETVHTPGSVIVYLQNPWNEEFCTPTTWVVSGVDFGVGLCKVFATLFVPNPNWWEDKKQQIVSEANTRVPFKYLTPIIAEFEGMEEVAPTSSITNLIDVSYDLPNGTTINVQGADVQSEDFQRVWAVPRAIMVYTLWILFAYYLVTKVLEFFVSKNSQ